MSNPNTPYTQATNAYGQSSTLVVTDQRALEGQVLMKAAQKLQALQTRLREDPEMVSLEEIDDTLTHNRKLWTVFAGETTNADHPLSLEIKSNIATLAIFVFKRTIELFGDPKPEGFAALIDINRQIAAGLSKQQPAAPGRKPDGAPAPSPAASKMDSTT